MEYWICFGESAEGTLKVGRQREQKDVRILSIKDDLSLGDLGDLTDRAARLEAVCPWHEDAPNDTEEDKAYINDYLDCWFGEILPALDEIGTGDTAVIWYGDNPTEACGMRFAVYKLWAQGAAIELVYTGGEHEVEALPELDSTIGCASAVGVITDNERLNRILRHVPQFVLRAMYDRSRRKAVKKQKNGRETVTFRGVGELHPEYVPYFYEKCRAVPACEAEKLAAQWEALVQENTHLRTLRNGKAVSVPDDHYDAHILSCMPDEPTVAARVIGRALADLPVSDMLIYRRLRALIASQAVECVQDGANYRELIIRRAK